MTDDTRNCDDVAEYLEARYPDLSGGVLVIHTKDNGEISEASSGKAKEELEKLRGLSNRIDDADSPYKAIVSVLMLKEGWDVRNVTTLDSAGIADYRSVIGWFARAVMKDLRLFSGYDALYGKVKNFVQDELFTQAVDLEHPNTIRNLSELEATKTIIESFKKAVNSLTIQDKGDAEIRDTIKLRKTRPFVVKDQSFLIPQKSPFNRIVGDRHFELAFAGFLEKCEDIVSYAKN
jgi:hypothetical protein